MKPADLSGIMCMNQSSRPGLGAEIQHWAGCQHKAQGPLRLHLSPMGCKWYAGLWMRAVSKPRAGPLLKDEFQLHNRMDANIQQWLLRHRAKVLPERLWGVLHQRGDVHVPAAVSSCWTGDPLIARSVTVIYDSFYSRGRGVLLPSARPQSWGCVVQQGGFVKPGYPLCTRDAK